MLLLSLVPVNLFNQRLERICQQIGSFTVDGDGVRAFGMGESDTLLGLGDVVRLEGFQFARSGFVHERSVQLV